jgi:proteic killer suppression protein
VWAVTVRANWRVTFRVEGGDAYDVNLEDYH